MHRRILWLVGSIPFILILLFGFLTADLPTPGALISRSSPDATKIYDRRGRLLYEILDPRDGRRTRLTLDEIPLKLRQAVLAVEDSNFYDHPGIDLRGIARAIVQAARERRIVSGGSTITQQLARDLLLSKEERESRSLTRKLREMFLALRLTQAYTKDQILEMYLNEAYFGQLAYGVEAAARVYFGKPARDLDLAESALLAGLIQSPAVYNPLVDIDAARRRQAVVLDLMVKNGMITADEAGLARDERLHFVGAEARIGNPATAFSRAPHFVTYVRNWLEAQYGVERVNHGGLVITTTLDLDLQARAQAIIRQHLADLQRRTRDEGAPDYNIHNAALVALDPATGEILAMVGSADYFDPSIDGAVNVALANRQPGSAIKPITYATAFGGNLKFQPLTPATVLSDVPTAFLTQENEPYRPNNYDQTWHGPISLRRALATSSNMIAVKVLDYVGISAMIDMARALGISTFDDPDRFGLALTLGGGEVKLLELTAAYAAFANQGRRVEPVAILKVAGSRLQVSGSEDLKLETWNSKLPAVSPQVAYLITDILSDDAARIPAFGEDSVLKLSRPAAAKTGTTTDFRDNWTIGYTPDLVVGVWAGNADNEPMRSITGVSGAGPIWHDFMEEALKGKPVRAFPRPPGLVEVEICETSGRLATDLCPRRRTELFVAGTEPTEPDNSYRLAKIDLATGLLAADGCAGPFIERVFRVLPSDAQEWGVKAGIAQMPRGYCNQVAFISGHVPTLSPDASPQQGAERTAHAAPRTPLGEGALIITSPAPNTTFELSPQLPLEMQRVELSARPGSVGLLREVTLLVDDQPIATFTRPPYRVLWGLLPGEHLATAVGVDETGQRVVSDGVKFLVQGSGQVELAH